MRPRFHTIALVTVLLLFVSIVPYFRGDNESVVDPVSSDAPFSVILMIGDGMGPEQVVLGSLVEYGDDANLSMQNSPLALSVMTFSASSSITDSAASATAIATGWKTNNGMISVLPNGTIVDTILESVQFDGKATGLVATSYIQHATPAAFATHVTSRSHVAEITRQFVEEVQVDVLLGGGMDYFSYEQLQEMMNLNYTLVQNRTELHKVETGKILGLFSGGHMDYEEVREFDETPSLAEMTNTSLNILSQDPDGFFLMVEGSRIDHAGHSNDPLGVALETIAFDDAVKVALDYVHTHENTILAVTADHETGGLTVVSHDLSDELPNDSMTEEERRNLRIERTQNITVTWSTDYHTATNVPLYCFGPIFEELANGTEIDNIDIFYELSNYYAEEPEKSAVTTHDTTTTRRTTTTPTTTETTTITDTTSTETTTSYTTPEPSSPAPSSEQDPNLPLYLGLGVGVASVVIVVLILWKRTYNG